MRNNRHFLALLLTLTTVISTAGLPVLAAEDVSIPTEETAVEVEEAALIEEAAPIEGTADIEGERTENSEISEDTEIAEAAEITEAAAEQEDEAAAEDVVPQAMEDEAAEEVDETEETAGTAVIEEETKVEATSAGAAVILGTWVGSGTSWRFKKTDGTYVTGGMYEIDGQVYYFDSNGYIHIGGWFMEDGEWYLAGAGGGLQKGWKKSGGIWYYLDESDYSMLHDGIYVLGDASYAFSSSGAMVTGWYQYEDCWYFFGNDGKMRYGWIYTGGKWYYADKSTGILYTDRTLRENGKNYRFTSSGAMVLGWYKNISYYEYYDSNGVKQYSTWIYSGGKWYYVNAGGVMYKNTKRTISGVTYIFDANGVCTNKE